MASSHILTRKPQQAGKPASKNTVKMAAGCTLTGARKAAGVQVGIMAAAGDLGSKRPLSKKPEHQSERSRWQLSYKPADPAARKAAEPRRTTAQLVSVLTRGSPLRGAALPPRVDSGIRLSPEPVLPRQQVQRYGTTISAPTASSSDLTAAAATATNSAVGVTDDSVATPAQLDNARLLAMLAARAESAVSCLTFSPAAASSAMSSRRTAPPLCLAAPSAATTISTAATTITTASTTAFTFISANNGDDCEQEEEDLPLPLLLSAGSISGALLDLLSDATEEGSADAPRCAGGMGADEADKDRAAAEKSDSDTAADEESDSDAAVEESDSDAAVDEESDSDAEEEVIEVGDSSFDSAAPFAFGLVPQITPTTAFHIRY